MTYIQHYDAPLGRILLAADEVGLTGLWFDGAKYFADGLPAEHTERETPVLSQARRWLDLYFAGREPGFLPPGWLGVSAGGVGAAAANSLRADRDLR